MEFKLHMPSELDGGGLLAQQWSKFSERFHMHCSSYAGQDSLLSPLSVLLFAAHSKKDKILADLNEQGIDPTVTTQVLEVVERACLPSFLLLFERFRYFARCQASSESVSEFAQFLRHQVELCQFGESQDRFLTSALINNVIDEQLRQKLLKKGDINFEDAVNNCNLDSKQSLKLEDFSLTSSSPEKRRVRLGRKAKVSAQESKEKDLYMVPVYDDLNEDEDLDDARLLIDSSKVSRKRGRKKLNKKVSPIKCFACKNEYCTRKSFRQHVRTKHADIRRFHCVHCNVKFESRKECISHCHHGHGRKFFAQSSSQQARLKMIADESYICWHCGETLPNLAIYKEHCLQHSAAVRVYTCDICQKKNHNIGRLIGHLKGHLVPRHKCDVCGNCFGRPELLEAHVQTHVNQPNHECLICNKSFVTSDRLQCHMRTHSGEKRFTCELCGKCFSQKMSFDYHKRWHAGEKPYECDICGRRTICYGDLKKHKRMHSDKRPYVCEVCGKSFRFISNLNRHRKGHSGKRLYVCQVCGRSFIYNEGLRDHIKAGRCPGMKTEAGAGGKSSNRGPRPRNSNAIVSISMMNLPMEGAPCSVVPPPPPQAQQTQMPIFTSKTSLNAANLPGSLAPALMSVAPSSSIAPLNQQQLQLPLPASATLVQVPAPPQHAQAQHIQHGTATALQEAFMTEYTPWPQYMIRNNIAVSEGGDGTQPGNNVVIVPQFY